MARRSKFRESVTVDRTGPPVTKQGSARAPAQYVADRSNIRPPGVPLTPPVAPSPSKPEAPRVPGPGEAAPTTSAPATPRKRRARKKK